MSETMFGGVRFVRNPAVPSDQALIISGAKQRPWEARADLEARRARGSVLLVNVAPPLAGRVR